MLVFECYIIIHSVCGHPRLFFFPLAAFLCDTTTSLMQPLSLHDPKGSCIRQVPLYSDILSGKEKFSSLSWFPGASGFTVPYLPSLLRADMEADGHCELVLESALPLLRLSIPVCTCLLVGYERGECQVARGGCGQPNPHPGGRVLQRSNPRV